MLKALTEHVKKKKKTASVEMQFLMPLVNSCHVMSGLVSIHSRSYTKSELYLNPFDIIL